LARNNVGLIFGKVFANTGSPAGGANVMLYSTGRLQMYGQPDGDTDSNGVFIIDFEWPPADIAVGEGAPFPFKLYATTDKVTKWSRTTTASGTAILQGQLTRNVSSLFALFTGSLNPAQAYTLIQALGADSSLLSDTKGLTRSLIKQIGSIRKLTTTLNRFKDPLSTEDWMIVGAQSVNLTVYG
jgi:hypothetical protein